MAGRAKWDAWSALEAKYGFTTAAQAEARYLELCKELGWVPDAAPTYAAHAGEEESEEEEEIDWNAPDAPARSAGVGGMANAVSVLQREEEEPLDLSTLHGVVLAGDLERLRTMETGGVDLNALDEYVSPLGMAEPLCIDTRCVIGVHAPPPCGGSGAHRTCSGAPADGCGSECSGT